MRRLTTEEWIAKSMLKHGDRWDYSRVEYRGAGHKVIIGCEEHGWFEQKAASHSNMGSACPDCGIEERALKKIRSG